MKTRYVVLQDHALRWRVYDRKKGRYFKRIYASQEEGYDALMRFDQMKHDAGYRL